MSEKYRYDFCGWATRNDIKCSDGRTIRRNAFKDSDGLEVPLFWNHQHNDVKNVIGKGLLHNCDEGVYIYGSFNDTEEGKSAKTAVSHGDIKGLSIAAHKLKQNGSDVIHGEIYEVSLVTKGANAGAYIENVLAHGEESEDEAFLWFVDEDGVRLAHSDEYLEVEDVTDGEPEGEDLQHKDNEGGEEPKDKTVAQAFEELDPQTRDLFWALLGAMKDEYENQNNAVQHSDEGDKNMSYNCFDNKGEEKTTLTHAQQVEYFAEILKTAQASNAKVSTVVNSVLQSDELCHGIESIDMLFPDFKELNNPPKFIKDPDGWVNKVMSGVGHTPFSKIKTTFADITEGEARANGYVTGARKLEEFFYLVRRETTPTTVYKLQKIDRDMVIDITSFDVVAFMKGEMRYKLNEELARAFLLGDGRNAADPRHINANNIRPIWTDDDLFTIKKTMTVTAGATDDQIASAFITAVIKAMDDYRGTGTPSLFCPRSMVTKCLLLKDSIGRVIYETREKLTNALGVKEIIDVFPMKDAKRVDGKGNTLWLQALIVNLADYTVGTNKGGEVNFFDDFDIDFNKYEYLMETRCCGALVTPFSAIALEMLYGLLLTVTPTTATTTRYGKTVSDLQQDVMVHDNWIAGDLKYVEGYTGFSGEVSEQSGHYLALDIDFTEGASASITFNGKTAQFGDDKFVVLRITKETLHKTVAITVTAQNGEKVTNEYKLGSLHLLPQA